MSTRHCGTVADSRTTPGAKLIAVSSTPCDAVGPDLAGQPRRGPAEQVVEHRCWHLQRQLDRCGDQQWG